MAEKPTPKKTPARKPPAKPTNKTTAKTPRPKTSPRPAEKTATVRRRRYTYDVCFSFAGENRDYVHRAAKCLKNRNVRVFYDNDEQHKLWGKDLVEHFDSLYQNQARYCVMFISEPYAKKLWTRLERRSALARAFRSKKEYILPARFDDTAIPGVPKTRAHIDLKTHKPLQLALLVIAKLRDDTPHDERFTPKPRPKFSSSTRPAARSAAAQNRRGGKAEAHS